MTTSVALEPESPESVAAALDALTRALTGAVTEADSQLLNDTMQQIQVRLDVQDQRSGRVTYDVIDDHPGHTDGRGGAVRTVRMDLPGSTANSLASLSDQTGKDMAFLMQAGVVMLCLFVEHLRAGRSVYAEDPASGRRTQLTVAWAEVDGA